MTFMPGHGDDRAAELRREAEEAARARAVQVPEDLEGLSPEAARQVLHELRVHQIELEMQNEELRRAQEALEASRERYFDLYDLAPVGYATLSEQGLILEANLTAATLLGVARGVLPKQRLARFIFRDDQDAYYLHRKRLFGSGAAQVCELRMVRADGAQFWARLEAALSGGADGDLVCRTTISNVSERKKAEETLRESEITLQSVLDASTESVFMMDPDGVVLATNETAAVRLGVRASDLIGRRIYDFHPPDLAGSRRAQVSRAVQSGKPLRFEDQRAGMWLDSAVYPIRNAQGQVDRIAIYGTDITERTRAQQALAVERQRLAVTLQAMGDGLIASDGEGRVTMMNRRAEQLTGWQEEEALGTPLADVFIVRPGGGPPGHDGHLSESIHGTEQAAERQTRGVLLARDGTERLVTASAAPVSDETGGPGVVLVFQDVTLQQRIEEELLKANKLESLGILAGGIAHDFNNLLTGILGNIALARLDAPSGSQQEEVLEEAEKASLRGRGLTRQLLTFARGGEPLVRRTHLPPILVDAGGFAMRGARSTISFEIAADLWPAILDGDQICQVVQNLVINADQAMAAGGKVTLSAENVLVSESDGLPLPSGRYVRISVTDAGVGIPPHLLSRIFDPYFTTKPGGSGIGLAVAYSVVAKHEGHIAVQSSVGEGSEFYVYLPAVDGSPALTPEPGNGRQPRRRVLVMDDEPVVRRVAQRMLKKLGYQAVTVSDGAEAVAAYREAAAEGEPFDLVILDLVVAAGMGGLEAMSGLQRLDPGVRAIVSSGAAQGGMAADFTSYRFAGWLAKPYSFEDLEATLTAVVPDGADPGDGRGDRGPSAG
ncbi:MAG: PAS domain-containing hybrid sensor histidine kinase/response regulator [Anaerolineae bacterium]